MSFYKLLPLLCGALLLFQKGITQSASRHDILITELFPDPVPVTGLPESEFIELKNNSATPFNLYHWKISDGNSTATININYVLQPDSCVIICSNAAAATYRSFGSAIGVGNFPSLGNEADRILLLSPEGKLIHAVAYTNQWYRNAVKSDGGWTIEMIDTRNPCTGSNNWKASTDPSGGTPGNPNSVAGYNPDDLSPALLRTYTIDSTTIMAVFDEPVDSITAGIVTHYNIDHGINNPIMATAVGPLYNEVALKIAAPLQSDLVYNLVVNAVTDCAGNSIGSLHTAKTGKPVMADSTAIAINELLFNPATDGYDYVELYNRSTKKTINLQQVYIANRSATGSLTAILPLSKEPRLFFPGDYLVLTENARWLQQHYYIKEPAVVIELADLPSMPDEKGTIVLLNQQGSIVEEVQYDHRWHFGLVSNADGIALERIDHNQPVQNSQNWTSAASTAGYGTPGYQNSQFRADLQAPGTISITPKIFSPDNDGLDDFVFIEYQVPAPNYAANIILFDAQGRPVRYLVNNAILGLKGSFRWDGLNDKAQQLPIGVYIVYTEIFHSGGRTKRFKQVVSLARRL